jgi:hypothetical protein
MAILARLLQSTPAPLPRDSVLTGDSLRRLLAEDSVQAAALRARYDSVTAGGLAGAPPPSPTAAWLVLAVLVSVVVGIVFAVAWLIRRWRAGRRPS